MITKKLIGNISHALHVNPDRILLVLQTCKQHGYMSMEDCMAFAEVGLPVFSIIGNVLSISYDDAMKEIKKGSISYDDLLCMIGIIAQDFKIISQTKFKPDF
ncbi:MAG: hypothetical protein AB2L20_11860 [Mangrovibacterium sp.]